MSARDIYDILKPLFNLSIIVGNISRQIPSSKTNNIVCNYAITFFRMSLFITIFVVGNFYTENIKGSRILVIGVIEKIFVFQCCIASLSILFLSYFNHDKLISVLNDVHQINTSLLEFKTTNKLNIKTQRFLFCYLFVVILLIFINYIELLIDLTKNFSFIFCCHLLTRIQTFLLIDLSSCEFLVLIYFLRQQFEILNKIVQDFQLNKNNIPQLKTICNIHQKMVDCAKSLNDMYSIQILSKISILFLDIITAILSRLVFFSYGKIIFTLTNDLSWIIYDLFGLFILCIVCSATICEVGFAVFWKTIL